MKLEIELEVPNGAFDKVAEAELIRSVKEQTALKLYAEGRVTTGEAGERRRRLRPNPAMARRPCWANGPVSAVVSDSRQLSAILLF
jgi:hypothetical protein